MYFIIIIQEHGQKSKGFGFWILTKLLQNPKHIGKIQNIQAKIQDNNGRNFIRNVTKCQKDMLALDVV